MSEMVERVAKVLYARKCAEIAADPTAAYRGPFSPFEELLKAKDAYLDDARAAIAAMREPTDEMWDAGAENLYGVSREKAIEYAKEDKFESDGHKAEEIWQALIDAALK